MEGPIYTQVNTLIEKLSASQEDSSRFLFEFCSLAEILQDKALNVLLTSQWMFFAALFPKTELMIDFIERDFNRPGMS